MLRSSRGRDFHRGYAPTFRLTAAMNTYPLLLILHLLAAFLFVGTVTFEVLFLEPVHKRLPPDVRRALGSQLAPRVRGVLPW